MTFKGFLSAILIGGLIGGAAAIPIDDRRADILGDMVCGLNVSYTDQVPDRLKGRVAGPIAACALDFAKGAFAQSLPATRSAPVREAQGAGIPYDRELYDHWIDEDGDCRNTRHELLADLSTGSVTYSQDGCTVQRGRWLDPYTDRIFYEARAIDIDHLVPLAYAHVRGADQWTAAQRRQFANDPVNLFAVDAPSNREKGAQGPTEWLPPNRTFQCSYVVRFDRIMRQYGLTYFDWEAPRIAALKERLCAG